MLRKLPCELVVAMINSVYNSQNRENILTVEHLSAQDADSKGDDQPASEKPVDDPPNTDAFDPANPPDNLRDILTKLEDVQSYITCCREHPSFKDYLDVLRNEEDLIEGCEWSFGDDDKSDPLEDVIHFVTWLNQKLPDQGPESSESGGTKRPRKAAEWGPPKKEINFELDPKDIRTMLLADLQQDDPEYDLRAEVAKIKNHPSFPGYTSWCVKGLDYEEDFEFGGEHQELEDIVHFLTWLQSAIRRLPKQAQQQSQQMHVDQIATHQPSQLEKGVAVSTVDGTPRHTAGHDSEPMKIDASTKETPSDTVPPHDPQQPQVCTKMDMIDSTEPPKQARAEHECASTKAKSQTVQQQQQPNVEGSGETGMNDSTTKDASVPGHTAEPHSVRMMGESVAMQTASEVTEITNAQQSQQNQEQHQGHAASAPEPPKPEQELEQVPEPPKATLLEDGELPHTDYKTEPAKTLEQRLQPNQNIPEDMEVTRTPKQPEEHPSVPMKVDNDDMDTASGVIQEHDQAQHQQSDTHMDTTSIAEHESRSMEIEHVNGASASISKPQHEQSNAALTSPVDPATAKSGTDPPGGNHTATAVVMASPPSSPLPLQSPSRKHDKHKHKKDKKEKKSKKDDDEKKKHKKDKHRKNNHDNESNANDQASSHQHKKMKLDGKSTPTQKPAAKAAPKAKTLAVMKALAKAKTYAKAKASPKTKAKAKSRSKKGAVEEDSWFSYQQHND